MTYRWASGSHVGRVRSSNEDSVHPTTSGEGTDLLAVVADGMGGAAAGEVASATALDAVLAAEAPIAERVRSANRAVHAVATSKPSLAGMGTTVTVGEFTSEGTARFGHVGDSRAYLIRDGSLRQLTTDHTVVAEWVAAGAITPEEAKRHPRRGMLTRSVGVGPDVVVDAFDVELTGGDRVILCSDGLNGMLGDDQIEALARAGDAEEVVWALIEAANSAGGHDNVTVLVVDVE